MFHPRAIRRALVVATCVVAAGSLCAQAQAHSSRPPSKSTKQSSSVKASPVLVFGVGRKAH